MCICICIWGCMFVYIRDTYVTKDTLVYTSQDDILCIKNSGADFR